MAMIKKRGDTYKITVSSGYSASGKQARHYMTFTPAPGMTERQADKAAAKAAADFERDIEQGYQLDSRQTFEQYAAYVLSLKERSGCKPRTLDSYRGLLTRINQAIGTIKLADIRPQHLNQFYTNLSQPGIRAGCAQSAPRPAFLCAVKEISCAELARRAGLAETTCATAMKGGCVGEGKARALAAALNRPFSAMFTVKKDQKPLSAKTILEYHRVISTILAQAEKEMLVPYNAAEKATPPKVPRHEPNYFQPAQILDILAALEKEPLKWRTMVNLMIVTGCRRGEIVGLRWDHVGLDVARVKIDQALLYTKSKGIFSGPTKENDVRYLGIPAETVELLRQWKAEQVEQRTKLGDYWKESGYVFTQDDGTPMNPDSPTRWLAAFSKRHSLPHINPHAFRHTVASVLIANGTDVVTVSKQLGHADVATTEGFYSHIIQEQQAKAVKTITDVLLHGEEKQA